MSSHAAVTCTREPSISAADRPAEWPTTEDAPRATADRVRDLDHAALIAAFQANTAAYFGQRGGDTAFAMELFRRAVLEQDQRAWQAIHDTYLPLVVGWITRHPAFAHWGRGEDSGYIANRAFERFWWALRPHRLANFPNLQSLLKYLKMCASCAVVDAARAEGRTASEPLDDCDLVSDWRGNLEQTQAAIQAEQLWQTVTMIIRDPAQEHLAWDTLVLGMTPREVLAKHPERWQSIRQIYEAKAALLRRLRASAELAELRSG